MRQGETEGREGALGYSCRRVRSKLRNDMGTANRRGAKFVGKMWIIVQKSEGLEMYMLELYQNPSYKDLVAFGSLKEGKEFVSKITGYTLENENDFVQGNKVEIMKI